MIRLTDKQIPKDTTTPKGLDPGKLKVFKCGYEWGARAGADAQLKEVAEWLTEDCTKHDHKGEYMWRRRCWECLQDLLSEIKDV